MTTRAGGSMADGRRHVDSILDLARTLIGIASQGGIDSPIPVIEALGNWFTERQLEPQVLHDPDGDPVGVWLDVGTGQRPRYCLNACVDTAPFGNLASWSSPPTEGSARRGWLYGRGAADSKVAISIFSHIGAEMASAASDLGGTLTLLFDADEHTGGFGGVKSFMQSGDRPDGVMIGYPGQDEIMVGARGFWRGRIRVFGRSSHSGSQERRPDNAVVKAATLVQMLSGMDLPADTGDHFCCGPKITVTEMAGGHGYCVVPDTCVVATDIRLTSRFDANWAEATVRNLCRDLDDAVPSAHPTVLEPESSWPAYRLPVTSKVATALHESARSVLGLDLPLLVAGPSNIGNLLASMNVEATCGFGLRYRNLHGADEAIELASIPPVYDVYLGAVRHLLPGRSGRNER